MFGFNTQIKSKIIDHIIENGWMTQKLDMCDFTRIHDRVFISVKGSIHKDHLHLESIF